MRSDAHLPEPAVELLSIAAEVAPGWLRRGAEGAARRGGHDPASLEPDLTDALDGAIAQLLEELEELLATDVDEQRTNPLSIFRGALRGPTELLRRVGVPTPTGDRFAAARFPDDEYLLGPATWSDVDPRLHEPGVVWGAWKAMTVLRRRREEGRR